VVPPQSVHELRHFLQRRDIPSKVVVEDLGVHVAKEHARIQQQKVFTKLDALSDFQYDVYHSYDEINAFIDAVAAAYPTFVSIDTFGQSYEKRDIRYLKIGYPSADPKKALFIDAGIHAREWIANAVALYTINQFTNNSQFTDLLQKIDIYVAPLINPDGYEYTRSRDRMWRKTRSGPRQGCYGVDPNRNYPYKWGYAGTSTNPCSEIYQGPSPLSEPECLAHANFINAHNDSFYAYLTLHSYGENWIYPWGYATGTYPPDVNDLKALGNDAYTAIKAVYNTRYHVGNSADDLYPAAGASDDYSKSVGVKYVYTVELRPGDADTDNDEFYGFELPEKYIMKTSIEVFEGIIVTANRVANPN